MTIKKDEDVGSLSAHPAGRVANSGMRMFSENNTPRKLGSDLVRHKQSHHTNNVSPGRASPSM